jgi:hypothetical protein
MTLSELSIATAADKPIEVMYFDVVYEVPDEEPRSVSTVRIDYDKKTIVLS